MPVSVKVVDVVGDAPTRGPSRDRLEQVAVGHEAEALVPRVVARLEVRVDVVAGRELRSTPLRMQRLDAAAGARRLSWKTSVVDQRRSSSARSRYASSRGSTRRSRSASGSLAGQRDDVARRALQHRHVRGRLRHRRDERDRRGAAADHDDALARVVEVLGPVLRVHDRARRSARVPGKSGV